MKKLLLIACAVALTATSVSTEQNGTKPFPLTVDSIMRGPELVGNPPNNLRWSGDSKELYFEWLIPKDDQPSTWVVGRDGGTPRRLTEAERRMAPLANGQWDAKRRRILGVDRGDVVIIDTVNHKRLDVTRTTGNESNPRWARGETHVTFVRDNNLFIVPVESVGERQRRAAHRRVGAPRRSAADRQPEVHQGRGSEDPRLGRAGSGPSQAPRRSRSRAGAAEVRDRRTSDHCRRGAVGRRQVRLPGRQRSGAVAGRTGAAVCQRIVFHRRDQCAHLLSATRRIAAASRSSISRSGEAVWAGPRRRERSDRDSEAAVAATSRGRRRSPIRRRSAMCVGARRS